MDTRKDKGLNTPYSMPGPSAKLRWDDPPHVAAALKRFQEAPMPSPPKDYPFSDAPDYEQDPRPDARHAILDEARAAVGKRALSYGTPEDNFIRIARHWKAYFKNRFDVDLEILPQDVALIMDLMKTARLEHDINHHDSWVDKAGYSACGAAIKVNMERNRS